MVALEAASEDVAGAGAAEAALVSEELGLELLQLSATDFTPVTL